MRQHRDLASPTFAIGKLFTTFSGKLDPSSPRRYGHPLALRRDYHVLQSLYFCGSRPFGPVWIYRQPCNEGRAGHDLSRDWRWFRRVLHSERKRGEPLDLGPDCGERHRLRCATEARVPWPHLGWWSVSRAADRPHACVMVSSLHVRLRTRQAACTTSAAATECPSPSARPSSRRDSTAPC